MPVLDKMFGVAVSHLYAILATELARVCYVKTAGVVIRRKVSEHFGL